ncbi:hypothetical protein [Bdellovibrio sp.]|uniref:hypothetical protein n=1 Tax=Bdellovibrio sp. TaxID=28201 RepID=UPI003221CE26
MKKAFAVFALVFSAQSLSYALTCQSEAAKAAYDHHLYIHGDESLISLNVAGSVVQDGSVYYRVEIKDLESQRLTETWVKVEPTTCKVLGIN